MSIISRLKRLEKISPAGGVALLILQDDGTWELSASGKRSTYKTEADAMRNIRPERPVIIIDV